MSNLANLRLDKNTSIPIITVVTVISSYYKVIAFTHENSL